MKQVEEMICAFIQLSPLPWESFVAVYTNPGTQSTCAVALQAGKSPQRLKEEKQEESQESQPQTSPPERSTHGVESSADPQITSPGVFPQQQIQCQPTIPQKKTDILQISSPTPQRNEHF